jgi:hypothetical protein
VSDLPDPCTGGGGACHHGQTGKTSSFIGNGTVLGEALTQQWGLSTPSTALVPLKCKILENQTVV